MEPFVSGLAEHLIGWVDERFGRLAAWLVGIFAVLALTAGTIVIGMKAFSWFGV